MSSTSSGIGILIIAGVMNASFTIPMKHARKWAWENTWLAWTIFALVVLPFVAALVTIPHLSMVYRSAPLNIILEVAGFGAGSGDLSRRLNLAPKSGLFSAQSRPS